jgi:NADH-quinone oxidoreductase subunit J
MDLPDLFLHVGLWAMTLLVLASAVLVVALRNLFRAALSLGLVLVGVAGLFVLLEAEFLAFVQILIYVGAILTLVIFAVMLTARVHSPTTSRSLPQQLPAAAFTIALFGLLARVSFALPLAQTPAQGAVSLQALGQELVTRLVLPFEVISLIFVAAMVGAIAVAFTQAPNHSSQSSFVIRHSSLPG